MKRGRFHDLLRPFARIGVTEIAAPLAQRERDEVTGGDGGGEGLGRGHADLGSGMRVDYSPRLASDGRAHHVGDGEHGRLPGARGLDGAEGVGGLSGLGDGDHQGPVIQDEVAISELRGDIHLCRQAGQPLDHEAAHQGRMVRRSAGDEDDPVQPIGQPRVQVRLGQRHHGAVDEEPAPQGVRHRARLLVDLLQHEVTIPALLRRRRVPLDAGRRPARCAARRGSSGRRPRG